jgi:hypothetical protein
MQCSSIRSLLGFGLGVLAGGCFSAELDERLGGVFACEQGGDDVCPEGMRCVDARCRIDEEIPVVEVVGPSDGDAIFDEVIPLRLAGNITLVPEGGEHVFGEGHAVIHLDGVERTRLEGGDLARAFDIPPEGGLEVGPHRISVELRRNDGLPYTHEGASANRLVFTTFDGDTQPRVAIVSPWPDSEIPADVGSIDVTIATLNFTIGLDDTTGDGHVHVFSDEDPPSCAPTNECTRDPSVYSAVFSPNDNDVNVGTSALTLPTDGRQDFTIATMLVTRTHNAFDPADPDSDEGTDTPVFDQVVVHRAAP